MKTLFLTVAILAASVAMAGGDKVREQNPNWDDEEDVFVPVEAACAEADGQPWFCEDADE